jgi:hypothetical protein
MKKFFAQTGEAITQAGQKAVQKTDQLYRSTIGFADSLVN